MGLMSTKEVANHYGKTEREVRYAILVKKLNPIKIGHALLFEKEELPKKWVVRSKHKKMGVNNES